ncbi:energy-coupling factor ABC transporter ATP-binding protein [Kineosporia sp. NBRC 101731]|uniref:energy-coupling factor ABC transporter ATP-binding protein n=1 Tax=Kineosporia sp. NBRC 101731 TaxID=3032199 RepID=UPI0024A2FC10|nr:energy-coupling factor ABC transporter ATP-binding protein [Kineosporia sp. NBRC 101731]GLY29264.1 ABC transporter ATP-binding protein [Kineosporia sp. NBRC 101731]
MSGLLLDEVSVRGGDVEVLHDVTCALDDRTIAVIGENGSGKSTLARLVGGLITASSGTVRVLGLDPARDAARLRHRVAMVFSNPDAQIIMPTVAEDVAFSLRPEKLPREEKRRRVQAALERFGLDGIADRSAHDLSGGQKQLLALCGAFVREPELVIADEPTAYLDARNARRVTGHLLEKGSHRLLLVTHDLNLAQRCDRVVFVKDGTIAAAGDPDQVVTAYEEHLAC